MTETRHILVLANSERAGGRCVAGKVAIPLEDGTFDVSQQWIRLNNPSGTKEGAVPYMDTVCRPNRTAVHPLDYIQVPLLGPCNNPDHPEDWNYDSAQKWAWCGTAAPKDLPAIADNPRSLWHGADFKAVPAGYIRTMPSPPASLYLLKAPPSWTLQYCKEWSQNNGYYKKRRRLRFTFAGNCHDIAVTDPAFDRRFNLPNAVSQWPDLPETLIVPNPANCHFCLSLTPKLNGRHYKVCATIFET